MTEAQWNHEHSRLKGAATRARAKLSASCGTLSEKLKLKRLVGEADQAISQHKLNYFELVADN
jgi:hypothetical protein